MKYFRDDSNQVYAFEEDGSQDAYIKDGLTLLGDDELAAIRAQQEAPQQLTSDQVQQLAMTKRDELLTQASLRIAPLQDEVDLGVATVDDVAELKLWKQYRIAVSRITSQQGFPDSIDWPPIPV